MVYEEIKKFFQEIDDFIDKVNETVPNTSVNSALRTQIARLLVISVVSTYEESVKMIMTEFAKSQDPTFSSYVEENTKMLNVKIKREDLKGYAKQFDPQIADRFENNVDYVQHKLERHIRKNLKSDYAELIRHRNHFAHTPLSNTTLSASIEETQERHKIARHVIYAFEKAFHQAQQIA